MSRPGSLHRAGSRASAGSIPELADGRRVCPLAAEAAQILFKTKDFLCSRQLFP